MKNTVLSVEIGEDYVKIVTAHAGSRPSVIDFWVYPMAGFGDDAAKELQSFLASRRIKPKYIVLCVPRSFVTMRTLHLPSQNDAEIKNMIELHLSRIVPYKREEVFFSHTLAGHDDLGYSRIIISVVQSEIIKHQIAQLEKAKLNVDAAALNTCGSWQWICRSFSESLEPDKIYLLLEIDAQNVDFSVFTPESLLFSQSLAAKSEDVHTELGQKKIIGEIRQLLLIFSSQEGDKKPHELFLSGVSVPSLAEATSRELDLPVRIAPCIIPEKMVQNRKELLARYSVTGVAQLAMQPEQTALSFELPELQAKKAIRRKTADLIWLCSGVLGILFCASLVFWIKFYLQQRYAQQVREATEQLEQQTRVLSRQAKRIAVLKNLLEQRQYPFLVVYQLQKIIPENIALYEITISAQQTVLLRGQALNLSDVFDFVNRIEQLDYFTGVQTKKTRKRKVQENTVTEFEVQMALR